MFSWKNHAYAELEQLTEQLNQKKTFTLNSNPKEPGVIKDLVRIIEQAILYQNSKGECGEDHHRTKVMIFLAKCANELENKENPITQRHQLVPLLQRIQGRCEITKIYKFEFFGIKKTPAALLKLKEACTKILSSPIFSATLEEKEKFDEKRPH